MWHTDGSWGEYVLMSFTMLVVVGLLIWGIVLLTRGGLQERRVPRSTAREILDERFARGEVEPSEYRERLEVLRSGSDRHPDPSRSSKDTDMSKE
jgi:putative membrane protein